MAFSADLGNHSARALFQAKLVIQTATLLRWGVPPPALVLTLAWVCLDFLAFAIVHPMMCIGENDDGDSRSICLGAAEKYLFSGSFTILTK